MYPHIPISTIADPFPQSFFVNLLPDDRFLVALLFSIESFTGVVQILGYENNILMTPVLWLYLTGVKDPWFIYTENLWLQCTNTGKICL